MEFKMFFLSLPVKGRVRMAKQCGVSVGHLRNIAYSFRKASPLLAVKIEKASNGMVKKETLLPDVKWSLFK